MTINIIAVGKIKDNNLKNLIDEYIKRLSTYCKINIIEVDDQSNNDNKSSSILIEKLKDIEGENILKKIPSKSFVINLDLNQKQLTSEEFAGFLQKTIDIYSNNIYFVIGGSYGLSNSVKQKANTSITLSKMTFTHQMTRLILLEQIYRGFKINKGETYHK